MAEMEAIRQIILPVTEPLRLLRMAEAEKTVKAEIYFITTAEAAAVAAAADILMEDMALPAETAPLTAVLTNTRAAAQPEAV
jgi:hypothetical protein